MEQIKITIMEQNIGNLCYYTSSVFGRNVTPKVGEYFIYDNSLLKIVSAENCKNCFFFRKGYCKLMFLEKGKIHCDYDSKINFMFDKFIIDK